MATASILINGVSPPNLNVTLGATLTLTNLNNTGVSSWFWEIVDRPAGSVAVLATPTATSTVVTLDKEGSYLFRLTVNGGESKNTAIASVLTLLSGLRLPSAYERFEADQSRGWTPSLNSALDVFEASTRTGQVMIGVSNAAMPAGTPVRIVGESSLANGDIVPRLDKALATTIATLPVIGVTIDAAGSSGVQIKVRTYGAMIEVNLDTSGSSVGAPVYVSDTGTLSIAQGAITNIAGYVETVSVSGHMFVAPAAAVGSLAAPGNVALPVVIDGTALAGTSALGARIDHVHSVATSSSNPSDLTDSTPSAGTSGSAPSRGNHTHAHGNRGGGTLHAAVTSGSNGFMIAADKVKLDTIATSAAALGSGSPAQIDANDIGVVGVAIVASREDHQHAVNTGLDADIVSLVDAVNAGGISVKLARADHQHAHGNRGGGSLHLPATPSADGFMSAADKVILDSLDPALYVLKTGSTMTGPLTIGNGSNFIVNTNTLFVDATNNRVGIGTSTPATRLDVVGDASVSGAVSSSEFKPLTTAELHLRGYTLDGTNAVNAILDSSDSFVDATSRLLSIRNQTVEQVSIGPGGEGYFAGTITAATPTAAAHLATKAYVDAAISGLDVKQSVRLATTADIDLATGTLLSIDGVTTVVGDRVLVKDQTLGEENGIYVADTGAWIRATDADTSGEVTAGFYTFVSEGTANGNTGWSLTTDDPITLDTTPLVFAQFAGGVGGSAITAKDEGSNLTTALASIDFVGAGVTASTIGNDVTVTIPGAPTITAKDEGSNLTTALTSIDFVGAGVTATNTLGAVTVTIPGGGGGGSAAGASGSIQFSDGAGVFLADATNLFWDNANNRVGIGTAVPGYPLHVHHATAPIIVARNDGTFMAAMRVDSDRAQFGSINSTVVDVIGGAAVKVLSIDGSATQLDFFTNKMSITSGGNFAVDTNVLFVDATNNRVGINDSTPAQALDVTGSIQFTAALMPGGTAGTAGQVLQSNGAGLAPTWVAGGGGGGSSSGNAGAVQFSGGSGAFSSDEANFFWDDTNNRLGINDATPSEALDVTGSINATVSVITPMYVLGSQKISNGAAAPIAGTWAVGDIVYNTAPVAGGNIGWVCVTAGTPGTWKEFGPISA